MGDRWLLLVHAKAPDEDVPPAVPVCPGALTATIDFGRGRTLSAAATPQEPFAQVLFRHDGSVVPGHDIVVEATCTDDLGEEIGYARLEGTVNRPMADSLDATTRVYPWLDGDEVSQDCRATTSRGIRPCIIDSGNNIRPR